MIQAPSSSRISSKLRHIFEISRVGSEPLEIIQRNLLKLPYHAQVVGASGQKIHHLHGDRLRAALTYQSPRRPLQHKTHTIRVSCHIGICPDTNSIFATRPCDFPNPSKAPG
ncbi:hypothetical protein TNCV_2800231 [Trichonephila clavipes]|nr:hypothetical protein TNCV_2800231 [Trichonephila clavipes]